MITKTNKFWLLKKLLPNCFKWGATRLVLRLDKVVIKFPRPDNFLNGCDSNYEEFNKYHYLKNHKDSDLRAITEFLCPANYKVFGIVIMERAKKEVTIKEFGKFSREFNKLKFAYYFDDVTLNNVMWWKGKMVLIDYANRMI